MKLKSTLPLLLVLGLLGALAPHAPGQVIAGGSFADLHDFTKATGFGVNDEGAGVPAALVQGSDGNFYGVASYGGANANGTVFRCSPTGDLAPLYAFQTNQPDGGLPLGALVQGSDGNFYGTTQYGGTGQNGTVFRVTPGGVESLVYSFTATSDGSPATNTDGAMPYAGLLRASDGSFYGTTYAGGAYGVGTIFRLTTGGSLTTLYNFGATPTSAAQPRAALIQARDGNFYGTTSGGGDNGNGTVFRLTPGGTFTVLYSFSAFDTTKIPGNNGDGAFPYGALVQGRDGNLYGTAFAGGDDNRGSIFRIAPADGALTVLHLFSSDTEGNNPTAELILGTDGNFYGVASYGGPANSGTVFRCAPDGTVTVLYAFSQRTGDAQTNADGAAPIGALVQGRDGSFYGTARDGGANSSGTVFRLTVPLPPAITSPTSATATAGQLFSYQITAANDPTSYGASGLPSGLTISQSTGKISGRTTALGTYQVIIAAFNNLGHGSATLTLTVKAASPVITSPTTGTPIVGQAYSYQITANNFPTSFGAANLPPGLAIDQSTGKISGTPTKAGTYSTTIAAFNSAGHGSATLTLTVKVPAPVITSPTTASGSVSKNFVYQITATNSPTQYGATGLPTGLAIDQTTGKISGTLRATGTYSILIAAFNAGGHGSATLTLTVKVAPPVVTSATSATATVGQAFSYQITAINNPTSYGASGLPSGLSINQSTGKISGTPTKTGTYHATIAAFNDGGSGSSPLTLTVK